MPTRFREVIVGQVLSGKRVEHRVFSCITRELSGMTLPRHPFIKELIENTITKAGLKVFACIFNRVYETGRKVVEGLKESMSIVFDKHLG